MSGREVNALSGLAANPVPAHDARADSGVQFTLFGTAYTLTLNTAAVIVVFLIYHSWPKG